MLSVQIFPIDSLTDGSWSMRTRMFIFFVAISIFVHFSEVEAKSIRIRTEESYEETTLNHTSDVLHTSDLDNTSEGNVEVTTIIEETTLNHTSEGDVEVTTIIEETTLNHTSEGDVEVTTIIEETTLNHTSEGDVEVTTIIEETTLNHTSEGDVEVTKIVEEITLNHTSDFNPTSEGDAEVTTVVQDNILNETDCDCGPANANCTLIGSQKYCLCPPGYANKDAYCHDLNECADVFACASSGAMCVNIPGSYRCDCRKGYQPISIYAHPKYNTCREDNLSWWKANSVIAVILGGTMTCLGVIILLKHRRQPHSCSLSTEPLIVRG